MPDWIVPTLVALAPVLTALITGVVAWRWGDAERKALLEQVRSKEAQLAVVQESAKGQIEALKLANEALKVNDVKEVNARYLAVRETVKEMGEIEERLKAQFLELSKNYEAEVALISDMLEKLREVPQVQEYLDKLADRTEGDRRVVFSQLNSNAASGRPKKSRPRQGGVPQEGQTPNPPQKI